MLTSEGVKVEDGRILNFKKVFYRF